MKRDLRILLYLFLMLLLALGFGAFLHLMLYPGEPIIPSQMVSVEFVGTAKVQGSSATMPVHIRVEFKEGGRSSFTAITPLPTLPEGKNGYWFGMVYVTRADGYVESHDYTQEYYAVLTKHGGFTRIRMPESMIDCNPTDCRVIINNLWYPNRP